MKTTTYEKRLNEEKFPVSETCICDVCHNVIYERDIINHSVKIKNPNVGFWICTTCHIDFGLGDQFLVNKKDVCSKECLSNLMLEYIERSSNPLNSEKIECEHMNF